LCNNETSTNFFKTLKIENPLEFQLRQRATEITRRSKLKSLPCDKKMFQVLTEIYEEQNGLCYYTKIPLEVTGFHNNNPLCFVVDKIIPEKGYVKGNMVFCCNAINKIKSSFTIEELKHWVSLLD
jgi:hypothetical protein